MNKFYLSNEAISIAVLIYISYFSCKVSFEKYYFISFDICISRAFWTYSMKYSRKSFLYYQPGSKSLMVKMVLKIK